MNDTVFNKSMLIKFLKLYNLGSINVDPVKLVYKAHEGVISTSFHTFDELLLGMVRHKNFTAFGEENHIFGISNTKKLLKFLGGFEENINVNLQKVGDKYVYLHITDSNKKHSFPIHIDLDMIPSVPDDIRVPEMTVNITLSDQLISDFVYFKGAFPDVDSFIVKQDGDKVKFIIGSSLLEVNGRPRIVADRTELSTPAVFKLDSKLNNMGFKLSYFTEIITNNADAETKQIAISNDGLLSAKFSYQNFDSVYYLLEMEIE